MKYGRLQCKDIPTQPILDYLTKNGGIGCTHFVNPVWDRSVTRNAMPEGINENLALAKMRSLLKKKLVIGCDCGCRGDWEIVS